MSRVYLVVTARMNSSRLPGKPLVELNGKAMLHWVLAACRQSELATDILLATPDVEIQDWGLANGVDVCMTSHAHERATDRMAEVASIYSGSADDIFVLVQGDEPLLIGENIDQAITKLKSQKEVFCVNLVAKISSEEEKNDVNCVKAVCNPGFSDRINWFSRLGVPFNQSKKPFSVASGYKQVCVIPFWRATLEDFSSMRPSPSEEIESIDMLRVLEAGETISCVEILNRTQPVDLPADIALVEGILNEFKNVQ